MPETSYHYRLEWDIIGKPAVPGKTHMQVDFTGRDGDLLDTARFREYKQTLEEAQEHGMCKNIVVFHQEVTVSDWRPGEPLQDATAEADRPVSPIAKLLELHGLREAGETK